MLFKSIIYSSAMVFFIVVYHFSSYLGNNKLVHLSDNINFGCTLNFLSVKTAVDGQWKRNSSKRKETANNSNASFFNCVVIHGHMYDDNADISSNIVLS